VSEEADYSNNGLDEALPLYRYWDLRSLDTKDFDGLLSELAKMESKEQFWLSKLLTSLPIVIFAFVWLANSTASEKTTNGFVNFLISNFATFTLFGVLWLIFSLSLALVFILRSIRLSSTVTTKTGWNEVKTQPIELKEAEWGDALTAKLIEKNYWLDRTLNWTLRGFLGAFYLACASLVSLLFIV